MLHEWIQGQHQSSWSIIRFKCQEDQLRSLINSTRPPQFPVGELVGEVGNRVRLTLLLPWLEAQFHEGLEDSECNNVSQMKHEKQMWLMFSCFVLFFLVRWPVKVIMIGCCCFVFPFVFLSCCFSFVFLSCCFSFVLVF